MTHRQRPAFLTTTQWSRDQLEADRRLAEGAFRLARMREPLEAYLAVFTEVQRTVETLLAETGNLAQLESQVDWVLREPALLEVFRYLTAPPISLDDLRTLADAPCFAVPAQAKDPDLLRRLFQTIWAGLDRRRFPWVAEARAPTDAERQAAVLASTALIATRRVETLRRNEGKREQEAGVRAVLIHAGLREVAVPGRAIPTLQEAPRPGSSVRRYF